MQNTALQNSLHNLNVTNSRSSLTKLSSDSTEVKRATGTYWNSRAMMIAQSLKRSTAHNLLYLLSASHLDFLSDNFAVGNAGIGTLSEEYFTTESVFPSSEEMCICI